jgi:phospholipid/cholesterol/gamma-HCH transport system substrate-binding protein
MSKQAPTRGRIVTMVAFAASCIGLLLFLWMSFGGSVPLAPEGYRFNVEFNDAVQLATQSDVRISGVSVGKVVSVSLDHRTGLTRAVIQIDNQFAPRPADTRAILREKSLLGETYVELTPGSQTGPKIPDGGTLPHRQVAPSVQLDQILSTFDPTTRRAFEIWMQQGGIALTGRGEDLNSAVAQLFPFATNVDKVLAVLHRQSAATTTLLRDGGQVFAALSSSPAQLQGLITNSNAVFAATSAQDAALAATVRAFPPFLIETRSTVDRVARFARETKPLIDELRPAVAQLTPALQALTVLAPELRDLMVNVGPLTSASKAGFPALEHFLDHSVPLLARLTPYLGGVVPVVNYINDYRREIAGFFANGTAATQATVQNSAGNKLLHYIRVSNPVNPEVLATYQKRLSSNRSNPYLEPGGYTQLLQGLPAFASYLCTPNPLPTIGPSIPATLATVLQSVYFTSDPSGPPCRAQTQLGKLTGQLQDFPQLKPLP